MTIKVRLTIEAETIEDLQEIINLTGRTISVIQPDANTRTKSSHGGDNTWYELLINPPEEPQKGEK
jgi:hypothetical protein